MPLTVNVGLSRKAARHFQSVGLSLNFTAELDSALRDQPERLQARVQDLYAQVEQALEHQATRMEGGLPPNPATPSQHRAIAAICRRLDLEPVEAARQHLDRDLAGLAVAQASQLIGQLERREAQAAAAGNGAAG